MGFLLAVDPLAAKELGTFSRRWQTYFVRVLYVGITGTAVWQFWRAAVGDGSALQLSDYAELGRELFLRFVVLQAALIPLAAIAAASDLVSREARAGTLGLLVLTGLTPRKIAWAKWRAATAYAGLLVLVGLPVVSIAIYLGAAGPWELAWSTAVTLSLASVSAAMALRFSASCESSGRAVLRTLLALAGWSLLLGLVSLPALLFKFPLISWLHPAGAAVSGVTEPTDPAHAGSWLGATLASGVYTWLLVRDAGKRIARRANLSPRPPKAEHGFGTLVSYYSPRLRIERGVWDRRPLLWKELATRAAGRIHPAWRIAVFWFSLAFGVLCWGISNGGRHLEPFYVPGAAFLLYAAASGSFLFVREREGRRWDLLLSTPARPREIAAAKLASGVVAPESLAVLLFLALGVLGWSAWAGAARTLIMGLTVLLYMTFAYVLAAAASVRSRTPRGAFVFTLGVLSVSLFVVPYLLSLPGRFAPLDGLAGLSPVTLLDTLFSGALGQRLYPGRPVLMPVRGKDVWSFLVFAVLHGTIVALILAALVRGVRSVPERA